MWRRRRGERGDDNEKSDPTVAKLSINRLRTEKGGNSKCTHINMSAEE